MLRHVQGLLKMAANNNGRGSRFSRRVALGGIFCAISLLILLAGGIIPFGTFAAPIFAGLCLLPISIELGVKTALLCYAAVSVLGVLLVPDPEVMLFFIFLCGFYPLLHKRLTDIRPKLLQYLVKFVLFNVSVAAVYSVLVFIIASPAIIEEFKNYALWFLIALLVCGNLLFYFYDRLCGMTKIIYTQRVRKYLFKN